MTEFGWWLLTLILIDLAVTVAVVRMIVVHLRGRLPAGMDLAQLREFTSEIERTIDERIRSRWSGSPETLPAVLAALLDDLQAMATARRVPVERPLLRSLVMRAIASRKLVGASELRAAAKKVA